MKDLGMLRKIFFSFIVLVIFCILLEGVSWGVYAIWYKKRAKKELAEASGFYMHDPVLGWTLTPNFEGYRVVQDTNCYYKTNSLGLRNEEYPFVKEKSVFRILCLGDSITEGMRVDNDGAYPKLLEKLLNKNAGPVKYEVLNSGVVDYCTEQEYIFLKERGLRYNPDMVILGYCPNDGRGFIPSRAIYLKNYDRIINKSKFLYILDRIIMKYKIKYQYKLWEKDRHEFWKPFYNRGTWRSNQADRYKLIELSQRDWGLAWTDKGWQRVAYYLDRIVGLSHKYNFKFVIIAFPVTPQLYASPDDSFMFLPEQRLQEYCRRNDVIFIDPLPHFRRFSEKEVFFDNMHNTQFGLGLVAQIIYEHIKTTTSSH